MLQSWKRIVVPGMLIVTGLGASGFLGTPQAPPPRARPVQPPPARWARATLPILVKPPLALLKEVGKPHGLTSTDRHVYFVDLRAGQLLRAAVQQVGIDVRLDLIAPSGEHLFGIDTPMGPEGEELVLLVACWSGRYRMEVSTSGERRSDKTYVIKAAEIRRASPKDRRQAAALRAYYEARELGRQGKTDSVKLLKAFESAVDSLEKAEMPRQLRAYAWQELGKISTKQKRWQEGLKADWKAVELFHHLGLKGREASALIEVGLAEQGLPRIEDSLRHLEQALSLAHTAGAEAEEASASLHLGRFYIERAQVANAAYHIRRAFTLREKSHDDERLSAALNTLSLLYMQIGEDEKALRVLVDQLQRLRLKPLSRAVVLTQIGNVYVHMGRPENALQYFQQAYGLQKVSENLDDLANTLVGFGVAFTRVRDFRNAVDSFQKALKVYQRQKNLGAQAIVFMNIGWALGSLQHYEEAKDAFRHALFLAQSLKNQDLEGKVLLGFAWVERLRGNLSAARWQAEEALKRVEATRRSIADQDLKISYFAGVQSYYDFLVSVLMEQYDLRASRGLLESALEVSEGARSRSLLDALGASAAASGSPVLTAREIRKQALDSGTILLEYSLGELKSYLFLVTSSDIQRFELPPREEIEPLAKEANAALAKSNSKRGRSRALKAATRLSHILTGPVAGRLGNKRLLIVTSGALHLVPLGVLPDLTVPAPTKGPGLVWPEPLLLRHEIVYEPSASVLAGIRRRKHPPARGLLAALGDAVFESDDQRIPEARRKRGGSDPDVGHLKRLAASRGEVDAITAGLPREKILKALDFDANIDLFASGKLNNFGVVHIATHTYYLPRPERSAMVLSRFDARGRARPGLLRIKDISAMDLRAELVVLSSCSSGVGKQVRGEGIVGWPWAFLSIGASEVVMSLWEIGDPSTAELMKRFYENMSRGTSSGRALQEAQVQIWSEKKLPWAWAGFVAQGEWDIRPLFLNKTPAAVSSQGGDPRNRKMTKKSPPLSPLR
jgi:CHAT domain-containing protein/Tfp pilus assembly protein PilF